MFFFCLFLRFITFKPSVRVFVYANDDEGDDDDDDEDDKPRYDHENYCISGGIERSRARRS